MKKIKGFLSYKKSGLKNPDKADLNKDKKITGYEKARGKAVQGAVKEAYAGAETELNKSLEYAKFYLEKSVETIDELDAIELENIKSRLEVIVDNFNSVYDDYFDLQENVFSLEDDLEEVTEKWKGDVKVKKTGEHAGKTVAELKTQLSNLKDRSKAYQERGERVPKKIIEKEAEIKFAIRAKQGWKKGEGATK